MGFYKLLRWSVFVFLVGGCAGTLSEVRERDLACEEACMCVADHTHTLLSSSSYDGFDADTCTCWTMGNFGERRFATVPRTMPPGACR